MIWHFAGASFVRRGYAAPTQIRSFIQFVFHKSRHDYRVDSLNAENENHLFSQLPCSVYLLVPCGRRMYPIRPNANSRTDPDPNTNSYAYYRSYINQHAGAHVNSNSD